MRPFRRKLQARFEPEPEVQTDEKILKDLTRTLAEYRQVSEENEENKAALARKTLTAEFLFQDVRKLSRWNNVKKLKIQKLNKLLAKERKKNEKASRKHDEALAAKEGEIETLQGEVAALTKKKLKLKRKLEESTMSSGSISEEVPAPEPIAAGPSLLLASDSFAEPGKVGNSVLMEANPPVSIQSVSRNEQFTSQPLSSAESIALPAPETVSIDGNVGTEDDSSPMLAVTEAEPATASVSPQSSISNLEAPLEESTKIMVFNELNCEDPPVYRQENGRFAAAPSTPPAASAVSHGPTSLDPRKCICGKRFVNARGVIKHVSYHAGMYCKFCEICGKKCKSTGSLTKHMRTHRVGSSRRSRTAREEPQRQFPRLTIPNTPGSSDEEDGFDKAMALQKDFRLSTIQHRLRIRADSDASDDV